MRLTRFAAVVVVAACTSSVDVATEQHLQGNFVHESGREMRYLVWLPDGFGEDRDQSKR